MNRVVALTRNIRKPILQRWFSSSTEKLNEITEKKATEVGWSNQSTNHPGVWSANQRSRELAFYGPRFEQKDLSAQPRSMAAVELVSREPVRIVNGRKAVCDGGNGPLGHPRVYINLDDTTKPHACLYCGLRFQQKDHH